MLLERERESLLLIALVGYLLFCLVLASDVAEEMSFPQLGYPQYLSASQAVYGGDRPGVLTPSSRGGSAEIGGSASAAAAAVSSVLGMYPYAHNYSAFLPYTSADLALFSQMVRKADVHLLIFFSPSEFYCFYSASALVPILGLPHKRG